MVVSLSVVITVIVLILAIVALFFIHHQNKLKIRVHLMREALRNKDFSFSLPLTKGWGASLFYGEKAFQETLNDVGKDINTLVARNEVEAWQKLTRVLTHEIMNVTTPIQSISQAYLESPKVQGTSLEKGICAINKASTHLVSFVDSYRKLTQLQEPVIAEHDLDAIISSVTKMFPNVHFENTISSHIIISIDESLMHQVLVNVIKNAAEAGAQTIAFDWHDSQLYISNDGTPIPAEVRRDIFIPFYTTKTTGSGIGLSLSRQIMTIQGGSLSLAEKAQSGYHTTFILSFDRENVN